MSPRARSGRPTGRARPSSTATSRSRSPSIKERHERIGLWGSADLVQTLLRHDLVDRLDLWIYPLLLGTGKRIFAEGTVPAAFRLTSATPFERGAVHVVYERAGHPTYGEMGPES